jgi:hypothetical protein
MTRRAVVVLLAAVLVGAGVPVIAWAHPGVPPTIAPVVPASPSPASPDVVAERAWTSAGRAAAHVLALLVVGIALVGPLTARHRRGRRLVLVGICLVLVLVGFEGALHSVHHLGDLQQADRCPVASGADHVSAVDLDVPRVVGLVTMVPDAVVPPSLEIVRAVCLAPAAGRGPPA